VAKSAKGKKKPKRNERKQQAEYKRLGGKEKNGKGKTRLR